MISYDSRESSKNALIFWQLKYSMQANFIPTRGNIEICNWGSHIQYPSQKPLEQVQTSVKFLQQTVSGSQTAQHPCYGPFRLLSCLVNTEMQCQPSLSEFAVKLSFCQKINIYRKHIFSSSFFSTFFCYILIGSKGTANLMDNFAKGVYLLCIGLFQPNQSYLIHV